MGSAILWVTKAILAAAGGFAVYVGFRDAILGTGTVEISIATFGALLLMVANFDRFETLKIIGFEAKLTAKIDQAEQIFAAIRSMAELACSGIVDLDSKAGRWDSAPSVREAYERAQRIKSLMQELGSTPTSIARVLHPWVSVLLKDVAAAIVHPAFESIRRANIARGELAASARPSDWQQQVDRGAGALEQLRNLSQVDFDADPQQLERIVETLPLEPGPVRDAMIDHARAFRRFGASVVESLDVPDRDRWFKMVDDHRER